MDAEFRCCRYVMLGVVSRGRREEGPWRWMLHASCSQHVSQHGPWTFFWCCKSFLMLRMLRTYFWMLRSVRW
jgi:hypothetical protein